MLDHIEYLSSSAGQGFLHSNLHAKNNFKVVDFLMILTALNRKPEAHHHFQTPFRYISCRNDSVGITNSSVLSLSWNRLSLDHFNHVNEKISNEPPPDSLLISPASLSSDDFSIFGLQYS